MKMDDIGDFTISVNKTCYYFLIIKKLKLYYNEKLKELKIYDHF